MSVKEGDKAPDFILPGDGRGEIALASLSGWKVVLYFYPKDDTPGCTKQAIGFRDTQRAFSDAGAAIVGISRDSVAKHDKFKAKHDLSFPLLCDEDGGICEAYGVWVEKSMYGRKYMGIERSTFLIDGNAKVARVWRKVKVTGHVEEVLAAAKAL